jgi:hypothetical protein
MPIEPVPAVDHEPAPAPRAPDPRRQPVAPAAQQGSPRQPAIRQAVYPKEAADAGQTAASGEQTVPSTALRTLRDRLIQRQQR